MKLGNAKGLVMPALGVGVGMLASPKIQGVSPVLAKYPYITPIILVFVALALMSSTKTRPFALGLGAVAMVFLGVAIYNKVKGITTGAPASAEPTFGVGTGKAPISVWEDYWSELDEWKGF